MLFLEANYSNISKANSESTTAVTGILEGMKRFRIRIFLFGRKLFTKLPVEFVYGQSEKICYSFVSYNDW